jgi:zinc transport system substrate-binding protein
VTAVRLLTLIVSALLLSGCGGSDTSTHGERTIVAAFYPLAWAAEQVAGSGDVVVNLTPPGVEPHDIELTPGDVERVRDADLVLYLGRGFMPALEDAVEGAGNAVDLLAGQDVRPGEEPGEADPHIWLDPTRYATAVREIAAALGDPDAAEPLVARLNELDREFRHGLVRCDRREIVTSHAAFGYLADAYDLEQIALTGVSPEAEPSPRALEDLAQKVDEEGATTVFFETLVSPRLAETVARETGARTAALNPLEGLTDDDLTEGQDYFTVMRANLAALREALGCR